MWCAVAPKGVNTSNVVTFEVKVEVTSANRMLLRPTMTATAKIICASRLNALAIPVEAFVHASRGGDSSVTQPATDGSGGRSDRGGGCDRAGDHAAPGARRQAEAWRCGARRRRAWRRRGFARRHSHGRQRGRRDGDAKRHGRRQRRHRLRSPQRTFRRGDGRHQQGRCGLQVEGQKRRRRRLVPPRGIGGGGGGGGGRGR